MVTRNQLYNKKHFHWVCEGCLSHFTRKVKNCESCKSPDLWTFDSDAEYQRYQELSLLAKAGKITDLQPKLVFPLVVYDHYGNEVPVHNSRGGYLRSIPTYECDFMYYSEDDAAVVEDVKSRNPKADHPTFKLKARLFEALYLMPITIVRR